MHAGGEDSLAPPNGNFHPPDAVIRLRRLQTHLPARDSFSPFNSGFCSPSYILTVLTYYRSLDMPLKALQGFKTPRLVLTDGYYSPDCRRMAEPGKTLESLRGWTIFLRAEVLINHKASRQSAGSFAISHGHSTHTSKSVDRL